MNPLYPPHMTETIREVRRETGPGTKYFYCGEYGETYGRPHYHCIWFGPELDWQYWWPYGNVHVGSVSASSARYVADYTLKSYKSEDFARLIGVDLPAPYIRLSKGLGKQWCLDHENEIRYRKFRMVADNGALVPVPRYFRKVLDISADEYYNAMQEIGYDASVDEYWQEKPEFERLYDFVSTFQGPVDARHTVLNHLKILSRKENEKRLIGKASLTPKSDV